jgi:hypothetical protein
VSSVFFVSTDEALSLAWLIKDKDKDIAACCRSVERRQMKPCRWLG